MSHRLSPAIAAAMLLILAACQDQPMEVVTEAPSPPAALAELRCRADALARTLSCESASGGGGASRNLVTVGGQNHFVRLASSGTTFDGIDTLSATVTVQNLLLVAMGTRDGSAPHARGVRVFFAADPTDGVEVANPTGTATFTSTLQPYFQYSGADLGGDEILSPDESSAGKVWKFAMNGATSFTFTVYVQTEKPTGQDYGTHFTQVSPGGSHTCALDAGGKAYCWGSDEFGQLGNGETLTAAQGVPSPVMMPAGVTFDTITAGLFHTCALDTDGKAYCWGWGYLGILGNPWPYVDQPSPVAVTMPEGVAFTSISPGTSHTCALDSDGIAYCWGYDGNGQLGNGAASLVWEPSPVVMPGVAFTSISAGSIHTCAIGSNGNAYCWGDDSVGELGDGPAWVEEQHWPTQVLMPAGVTFTAISAGGDGPSAHTCALGSDDKAYCWGSDVEGKLGNGATTDNQLQPAEVAMPAGVSFNTITVGALHTCALGSDNKTYCWGDDNTFQLGDGATTGPQPAPSEVTLPAGVVFTGVQTGSSSFHTCAVSAASAYCWGSSGSRRLGDGADISRASPVVVAASR